MDVLGSIDAVVLWQNSIKPDRCLGCQLPVEVFWSALTPERILGYVNNWFWDEEKEECKEGEMM